MKFAIFTLMKYGESDLHEFHRGQKATSHASPVITSNRSARQCWPIDQTFGESIQFLSVLRKHPVIGLFSLFSFFLCFALVTINRQPSYDFGILLQDYGIIRGFIGHHQSANLV